MKFYKVLIPVFFIVILLSQVSLVYCETGSEKQEGLFYARQLVSKTLFQARAQRDSGKPVSYNILIFKDSFTEAIEFLHGSEYIAQRKLLARAISLEAMLKEQLDASEDLYQYIDLRYFEYYLQNVSKLFLDLSEDKLSLKNELGDRYVLKFSIEQYYGYSLNVIDNVAKVMSIEGRLKLLRTQLPILKEMIRLAFVDFEALSSVEEKNSVDSSYSQFSERIKELIKDVERCLFLLSPAELDKAASFEKKSLMDYGRTWAIELSRVFHDFLEIL